MKRNGTPSLILCLFSRHHFILQLNQNDGHEEDLPPQHIQCFACPCCFLLFTKRDECLKHMSGKNHFLQLSKSNGALLLNVLSVLLISDNLYFV